MLIVGKFRAQVKTHGLHENVAGLAMLFLALEKVIRTSLLGEMSILIGHLVGYRAER